MEWEYKGKMYALDWGDHTEVYVTDEDGNNVTDSDVYNAACREVWDFIFG